MRQHSGTLERKWNRQLTGPIFPAGAKNAVWKRDYPLPPPSPSPLPSPTPSDKATNPDLSDPDWETILEIVEEVKTKGVT